MKSFGFFVGLSSVVTSVLLAISFFFDLQKHRNMDFHHEGILPIVICGIALGTILMVLSKKSD